MVAAEEILEEIQPDRVPERISGAEGMLKNKEKLPDAVFKYVKDRIFSISKKFSRNEKIFEEDFEFMDHFKTWLGMAKEDKEKFTSVEEIITNKDIHEAVKRHISISQWMALAELDKFFRASVMWRKVDGEFNFPGDGRIVCDNNLTISHFSEPMTLPDGLEVKGGIEALHNTGLTSLPGNLKVATGVNLQGCKNLKKIKSGLKVGKHLFLEGCTSLEELPDDLEVGWYMVLEDCKALKSLPKGLKVETFLNLKGCTGLTGLPDDLEVGDKLLLTEDMNEKVKSDA